MVGVVRCEVNVSEQYLETWRPQLKVEVSVGI